MAVVFELYLLCRNVSYNFVFLTQQMHSSWPVGFFWSWISSPSCGCAVVIKQKEEDIPVAACNSCYVFLWNWWQAESQVRETERDIIGNEITQITCLAIRTLSFAFSLLWFWNPLLNELSESPLSISHSFCCSLLQYKVLEKLKDCGMIRLTCQIKISNLREFLRCCKILA